jgi:hypothetical protein
MNRTEATMGAVKKFFDDRKNTSQLSRLYAFLRWPACCPWLSSWSATCVDVP